MIGARTVSASSQRGAVEGRVRARVARGVLPHGLATDSHAWNASAPAIRPAPSARDAAGPSWPRDAAATASGMAALSTKIPRYSWPNAMTNFVATHQWWK